MPPTEIHEHVAIAVKSLERSWGERYAPPTWFEEVPEIIYLDWETSDHVTLRPGGGPKRVADHADGIAVNEKVYTTALLETAMSQGLYSKAGKESKGKEGALSKVRWLLHHRSPSTHIILLLAIGHCREDNHGAQSR